jgi:hypothetical protein
LVDLASIESCTDLTPELANQAASSSTDMRTLLKRFERIAQPGEGCPKILMAVARLVGQEWLDGDLRVELSGDESTTLLDLLCDHGFGIRERLFGAVRFKVPLDEFERALELAPRLVLPLRISDEPGKLVLTPLDTPEARVKSMPPISLDVDSGSLGDGERTTAPPPADELQVVDEGEAMPEEVFGYDGTARADRANADDRAEDGKAEGRMESGPVPTASPVPPASEPRSSNIHTRPTVRRMVAIDSAAISAVKRRDPRREED